MENNLRLCRVCKTLKQRIQDGKFNGKDKCWKDEHGKLWSGNYCPPCNLERIKTKMKEKRNVKES